MCCWLVSSFKTWFLICPEHQAWGNSHRVSSVLALKDSSPGSHSRENVWLLSKLTVFMSVFHLCKTGLHKARKHDIIENRLHDPYSCPEQVKTLIQEAGF
jgi:hypothetical protein